MMQYERISKAHHFRFDWYLLLLGLKPNRLETSSKRLLVWSNPSMVCVPCTSSKRFLTGRSGQGPEDVALEVVTCESTVHIIHHPCRKVVHLGVMVSFGHRHDTHA